MWEMEEVCAGLGLNDCEGFGCSAHPGVSLIDAKGARKR